jgi:nucleoside-diphosphate-sugar epimerase
MKIVVLGANGQVGAEVCLLLAEREGIELVPVSRTRNGSAFLRSHGIAVWHGNIANQSEAQRIFADADVIANFALAGGVGRKAREANEAILSDTLRYSPQSAKQIFFSTLAVHGVWDTQGGHSKNQYGNLKLGNEAFFERLCRRYKRSGWIFRLGHVCGEHQGMTQAIRQEIRGHYVILPDPLRASNTTYVEAICDAIVAVGDGRDAPPGRFDLVNKPQWSWQEVYDFEASVIGADNMRVLTRGTAVQFRPTLKARLFAVIGRLNLRAVLERALPLMPVQLADQIRADFMVSRTANEIAALEKPPPAVNSAAFWPELPVKWLPGQRLTRDVLAEEKQREPIKRKAWPADLGLK